MTDMTQADFSTNPLKDYIQGAVDAGHVASTGPWGRSDYEKTIEMVILAPELEGRFLLWLRDRVYGKSVFNAETQRWEQDYTNGTRDEGVSAWFVQDSKHANGAPRQQGLILDAKRMKKEGFDYNYLVSVASTCPVCEKHVPANQLKRVAFADAACEDCYPAEQRKKEKPGWCD